MSTAQTSMDSTLQTIKPFPLKPLIFGSLAAAFEWYDYALFGYFAAIISTQFFPSADPLTSILDTFAVFASGFAMRPLGAIFFGYIGDRIGRKYALGASLLLMAIPTTALGLLPTYQSIGVWATVFLVLIRLLQGLAVGGNYGGSFIFTIENAPEGKKGFAGSLPSFGTLGGLFLGSGAATLLSSIMSESALYEYGWRIPFLLGSLSGLMGFAIRYFIEEEEESKEGIESSPIKVVVRDYLGNVLRSIGIILLDGVGVYTLFVFMTTYATTFLGLPSDEVLLANTVTMGALVVSIPFFGWLGDQIGARLILRFVSLCFIVLGPVLFFTLIESRTMEAVWLIQSVFSIVIGAMYATVPITVSRFFPRHVRYTASGLSFNISIAVFGGTTPYIATSLIKSTGSLLVPGFMLLLVGIVSLVALGTQRDK